MRSITHQTRKPTNNRNPIKSFVEANLNAIQTGIICAAVFFLLGIVSGLKLRGDKSHKPPRREMTRDSSSLHQSQGAVSGANSYSGVDTIRDWNDYDKASPDERQRHYERVANSVNQAGMKYHVTPKDIQEGVEAFYSE